MYIAAALCADTISQHASCDQVLCRWASDCGSSGVAERLLHRAWGCVHYWAAQIRTASLPWMLQGPAGIKRTPQSADFHNFALLDGLQHAALVPVRMAPCKICCNLGFQIIQARFQYSHHGDIPQQHKRAQF